MPRLFFALWPDKAVRDAVIAVRDGWLGEGSTPVRVENLHMTLAYLGPCAAEQQACIRRCADAVASRPVSLFLDIQGWWSRPRVAWLGLAQTPAELTGLVEQLWQSLETCGFVRERMDYKAHMTVARKVKQAPQPSVFAPIPWQVSQFALLESVSTDTGVRYQVLEHWDLSGRPPI